MRITEQDAVKYEAYQTPRWAVEALYKAYDFKSNVIIDPCAGLGAISDYFIGEKGHYGMATDIHPTSWGYKNVTGGCDFLADHTPIDDDFIPRDGVFVINPPFTKATDFVEKIINKYKIDCFVFQRFAWFESAKRQAFFDDMPLKTIYLCASRATCHRFDLIGRLKNGTTTAHAWFHFEMGYQGEPSVKRLYKDK